MSQEADARRLWFQHDDSLSSRDRLRSAVAALVRGRRLQLLVDHGFGGLLAGLCLATVAVLVVRLAPLPYPPWQPAGAAIVVALMIALLAGWLRRPDALEVAIRADLKLNLKQRLSTAWEIMTVDGNSELAERLAVQAGKAGLPHSREVVFPLQVNRWGRLTPLAATALLLVSLLDLNWMQAPAPLNVDEQVVSEGRRLGEFGRAMQGRARRDELPRSARLAEQLERLGARMEGSALSRGQALAQLREMGATLDEERIRAMADANQSDAARPVDGMNRPPNAAGGARGAMPREEGALAGSSTRPLARSPGDIERSVVPRQESEDALKRDQAGDDARRREIQEQLARIDRAHKEQDELQGAREQVRRAQGNLGERLARADGGRGPADKMDAGQSGQEPEDDSEDRPRGSGQSRGAARPGSQGASGGTSDRQQSPARTESGQSGPIIKPQGQVRPGEVFVSEGQVRPRSRPSSMENVQMSNKFASQVEEVLSREQFPAHHKDFIRRYFLNLSQGAQSPQQQPSGAR